MAWNLLDLFTFTQADGAPSGWTEHGGTGTFLVSSGVVVSTNGDYAAKGIDSPESPSDDMRVVVDVRTNSAGTTDLFFVRKQTGAVSGYAAWIGTGIFILGKWTAGVLAGDYQFSATDLLANTDYRITIDAEGTAISATVALLASPETVIHELNYTSSTYTSGGVGAGPQANGSGGYWDNFAVYVQGVPVVGFEGNSLVTLDYAPMATYVVDGLSVVVSDFNVAASGETLEEMLADYPTQVATNYVDGQLNVVVIPLCVTNDFYFSRSIEDVQADFIAYCAAAHADGFLVVCSTETDRRNTGTPVGWRADIEAWNAWMRSTGRTYADAFADIAAEPLLGDDGASLNETYFQSDKVHFTNAGAQLAADIIIPVLEYLLTSEDPITVTSPISTDRRIVGDAEVVTWDDVRVIPAVDILLSLDGGTNYDITLVSATNNDGSYTYTPTSEHITATAKIKVESSTDSGVFAVSATFKIATTEPGSAAGTSLVGFGSMLIRPARVGET